MELQRHPAWTALYPDISLQIFCDTVVPKIKLNERVNGDVQKTFIVIKDLLCFSYYKYEFIDVTVGKTLQTFEMALKLRYAEVTGEEWNTKKSLKQLIDWFRQKNYFEDPNPISMGHVRHARNYFSHPNRHGLGGPAVLPWIETIVDLINDLYEDTALRVTRTTATHELSLKIEKTVGPDLVAEHGENTVLVHRLRVIFINNKISPSRIYIFVFPIFDMVNEKVTQHPFLIEANEGDLSFSENAITFNNGKFVLRKPKFEHEVVAFKNWKHRRGQDRGIGIRTFLVESEIFKSVRRSFHFDNN